MEISWSELISDQVESDYEEEVSSDTELCCRSKHRQATILKHKDISIHAHLIHTKKTHQEAETIQN